MIQSGWINDVIRFFITRSDLIRVEEPYYPKDEVLHGKSR